jgi:AraC family transcriptional regulator, transcriptional activator of pobA
MPIPSHNIYKTLGADVSFLFQKLELSYHEYDSQHAHRHNYYEMLFFDQTGGAHEIDFARYEIEAGSVHLISPEQVHVLRRERQVTGYVLAFSDDLFVGLGSREWLESQHLFSGSVSPVIHLSPESMRSFHLVLGQLEEEYNQACEGQSFMLCLLVCQLLVLLKRNQVRADLSIHSNRITDAFKRLLQKHFLELSSVSAYADRLHISAGHLNDSIKQSTGKNAEALILEALILEARRLLYHSDKTVKEIAMELNFEDASHFTRTFRKATGFTPLEFRTHIREKYH